MNIPIPEKCNAKFVLLGSGYDLCRIADALLKRKFPDPVIVTHKKIFHTRDLKLLEKTIHYEDIFEYAKKKGLTLIEEDDINNSEIIDELLKLKCNIAFSHALRSIVKKEFLDKFHNLVFNIHPSLLPHERGAATYSWRILNDQNHLAATIHQVDEGIDTGHIVFQIKRSMNKKNPYPIDYDVLTTKIYKILIEKFLKSFETCKKLKLISQKDEKSSYFPRLHTETNGAIDFTWSANEIERFVRAFSYPYPGAFTFVRGEKIHVMECTVQKSQKKYHPFAGGRISKIYSNGSIKVITKDDFLIVKKIRVKNKEITPSEIIKINDVFYTPSEFIDTSRQTTVSVRRM